MVSCSVYGKSNKIGSTYSVLFCTCLTATPIWLFISYWRASRPSYQLLLCQCHKAKVTEMTWCLSSEIINEGERAGQLFNQVLNWNLGKYWIRKITIPMLAWLICRGGTEVGNYSPLHDVILSITMNEWMSERSKQMNVVKWKGINFHALKILSPPIGMQVVCLSLCLSVGINWITFDWKIESWPNFYSQYMARVVWLGWWPHPKGPTARSLVWQKSISRDPIFFVSFGLWGFDIQFWKLFNKYNNNLEPDFWILGCNLK